MCIRDRRETLARIIVKHNLDEQYREFAHAIAFFDCCETPGCLYHNLYENHKACLRQWVKDIRKENPAQLEPGLLKPTTNRSR